MIINAPWHFPRIGKVLWETTPHGHYFSTLSLQFHYGFSICKNLGIFHSHSVDYEHLQQLLRDGLYPLSIYIVCPNWEHHLVFFRFSFPYCMHISALGFPLSLHILRLNFPLPTLASKQSWDSAPWICQFNYITYLALQYQYLF